MKTLPIVLDTDIGDDVDDALALAIILNSPELELRGVTTVYRNAQRRAVLTQRLLEVWQRADVPVAAGCSRPLLQPFDPQLGSQFEMLEEDTLQQPTEHAVDFLIRTAGADAAETPKAPLTIVPIGPLTNIAVALAKAPQLASCARLVLMGGMWNEASENYRAEWNILCDPEAAAMVFNSGMEISMIGLDVTLKCRLRQQHLDKIAQHNSPRAQVLWQLLQLWMRETGRMPILHDPLAVLTLLDDCVRFEEKRIDVALYGEQRGQTRVLSGAANARVAMEVDAPRAIELFMERVLL